MRSLAAVALTGVALTAAGCSGGGATADWVGPGHNAVLFDGPRAYNVYHAYDSTSGASQLRIAELVWDAEGWPISGGP